MQSLPLERKQSQNRTLSLAMCRILRTPTAIGEETAPPEACRNGTDACPPRAGMRLALGKRTGIGTDVRLRARSHVHKATLSLANGPELAQTSAPEPGGSIFPKDLRTTTFRIGTASRCVQEIDFAKVRETVSFGSKPLPSILDNRSALELPHIRPVDSKNLAEPSMRNRLKRS